MKPGARALAVAGASAAILVAVVAFHLLYGPETEGPRVKLDFAPTEAQQRKMAALAKSLHGEAPRFATEDKRERENARLFMYMAAASQDDRVVVASLDAITAAYASRGTKKEAPDRDLERVLVLHLRSANPAHAQLAFSALRIPLMTQAPSPELLQSVVGLAERGQPRASRTASLAALDLLRPTARPASVLSVWLDALHDDPAIATLALLGLSHSGVALGQEPTLRARLDQEALRLTTSPEAGLRGLALQVATDPELSTNVTPSLERARTLLADSHPYVRGVAAAALGRSGAPSDIHALMPLTTDREPARTSVDGLTNLDAAAAPLRLSIPGRRLVAEVALHSVARLAEAWAGEPILALNLGAPGPSDQVLEKAIARARVFYEEHQSALPAAPAR